MDAGGPVIELAPASLSDLVSDCLESLIASAELRGITLSGTVDPDVDPVLMSAEKIGRVMKNLVENALHHTPVGGAVTITAALGAEGVVVAVEDDGPGFAVADLPHVFEQFYRGEQARSRDKGSAGLGLAIAQGIIQAHGGRIWAENAPGGGARVGFLLPNARSQDITANE